jgi:predicted DNA-binding transcriptional regulator AlpA
MEESTMIVGLPPSKLQDMIAEQVMACLRVYHAKNPATSNSTTPETGGLDLAEAITGLSRGTLYKMTCTRAIPHHKKGGKLYFFRDELLAWIREGNRPIDETDTKPTAK